MMGDGAVENAFKDVLGKGGLSPENIKEVVEGVVPDSADEMPVFEGDYQNEIKVKEHLKRFEGWVEKQNDSVELRQLFMDRNRGAADVAWKEADRY